MKDTTNEILKDIRDEQRSMVSAQQDIAAALQGFKEVVQYLSNNMIRNKGRSPKAENKKIFS